MEKILKHLFDTLKIGYTDRLFDYTSQVKNLAEVSQLCDSYKISNVSIRLDPNQLGEIPYPALVFDGKNDFFLLIEAKNDVLTLHDGEKYFQKSTQEFFVSGGVPALLFIADELSKEQNFEQNNKEFVKRKIESKIGYFAAGIFTILLIFYAFSSSILLGLLSLVNLAGLTISFILLAKENHNTSGMIDKLCTFNKKTDCEAVIHAEGSKLFNWLSWTDLGLLFFSGNLLAIFILKFESIPIILLLVLSSLPFTVFSVYFQANVVKKWCVLCLATLAVLWVNFVVLLLFNEVQFSHFEALFTTNIFYKIMVYLLPVLALFTIKYYLQMNNLRKAMAVKLARWEMNSELFMTTMANKRREYIETWQDEIVQGDIETPINITIVGNPTCSPCKEAHDVVHELVEYFSEEAHVFYRFYATWDDNEKNEIIRYILNLPKEQQLAGLHRWYEIQDFERFKKEYQPESNSDKAFTNHVNWTVEANISYTPTIFVNGVRLESPFSIDQLSFHIRAMIEQMQVA